MKLTASRAAPRGDQRAGLDDAVAGPARPGIGELFRQHHLELVRLAALMLRDQPSAEDVVQDVFAKLHGRVAATGAPGQEMAYVRACVLNACRSVLRRRATAQRIGRMAPHPGDWPPADCADSAEAEAIKAEDRRRVLAALAALSARRREVLVLRYYVGLTESEIAATLGISNGAVKSAAARGIAAMARDLGKE